MTTNELLEDLSKLRNTEIIRCQLEKDTLSLQVVFDNDEDMNRIRQVKKRMMKIS